MTARTTQPAASLRDDRPTALHWVSAAGIASIAIMRCCTVIAPQVVFFTVDPAQDAVHIAELGPVGSLVADALLICCAGLGLLAEGTVGRRVAWPLVALALLASFFVIRHGASDFSDMWRGATWIAGAFAGITAAHLARFPAIRTALTASLAAIAGPLVVRGLSEVFHEHPLNVRYFRENREAILQGMGIDPASNSALVFERRVMQVEATGWFRLANVFGSFMVFSMILWAGMLIQAIRSRCSSGVIGASALVGAASALALWYAGSKGAFAAAFAGLALLALCAYLSRSTEEPRQARVRPLFGAAAVLLPLCAIGAVVLRGIAVPERFLGDLSILFRWQYLAGAGRIIAEAPVFGVGPDGFQDAYVQHRLSTAPEEVASAHSMFVDWVAMLGIGGAALGAIAIILLWRTRSNAPNADHDEHPSGRRPALPFILLVAAAGFVPAFVVEQHTLDAFGLASRCIGMLLFIVIGLLASGIIRSGGGGWWTAGLAIGAIAFFTHAQIEVTMTHPGAMVAGWVLLGVAAAVDESRADRLRIGIAGAALLLLMACWLIVDQIIPAAHQQARMQEQSNVLEGLAERVRARPGDSAALNEFFKDRSALGHELILAYDILPSNPQPLEIAARSWLTASGADPDPAQRREGALEALRIAERLVRADSSPKSWGLLAQSAEAAAHLTGDPEHQRRAIDARRELVRLDPHGVQAHLALGDLLWDSGELAEAREMYRRTLQLSDNWHLDALRQLREAEIERIQQRFEME